MHHRLSCRVVENIPIGQEHKVDKRLIEESFLLDLQVNSAQLHIKTITIAAHVQRAVVSRWIRIPQRTDDSMNSYIRSFQRFDSYTTTNTETVL